MSTWPASSRSLRCSETPYSSSSAKVSNLHSGEQASWSSVLLAGPLPADLYWTETPFLRSKSSGWTLFDVTHSAASTRALGLLKGVSPRTSLTPRSYSMFGFSLASQSRVSAVARCQQVRPWMSRCRISAPISTRRRNGFRCRQTISNVLCKSFTRSISARDLTIRSKTLAACVLVAQAAAICRTVTPPCVTSQRSLARSVSRRSSRIKARRPGTSVHLIEDQTVSAKFLWYSHSEGRIPRRG